ncbi:hypothetical protein [Thioclava sp. F28-4]|uniref:hypothetical protein n=1 Tax=Thioclava sp. F28-4 TaxID=1915315 RepID=UPI001439E575|nr:hypothetical protein [Thioclava sp. F28-4]
MKLHLSNNDDKQNPDRKNMKPSGNKRGIEHPAIATNSPKEFEKRDRLVRLIT